MPTNSSNKSLNYKNSGVDVAAGDNLVDWLQSSEVVEHHQERIISGIGGFASLFRIGFPEMKKPCLVTCTDGVGTKVKIAAQFNKVSGIGQDLVAMCVNDLICTGGRPLMFLDYYATGKLKLDHAKEFLQSVRRACAESNCALTGGETAEMPGVYSGVDFDCAGFAVGIVDEDKTWGAHKVQVGDVLLGVSSSGAHSNGYSLLRTVFADDLEKYHDELLTPTALYVKMCGALADKVDVHAAAHITGGGLENIPRVLPKNTIAEVQSWKFPPLFNEVQARTGLTTAEMVNTLNCGLGFVFILSSADLPKAQQIVSQHFACWELGRVVAGQGEPQVKLI